MQSVDNGFDTRLPSRLVVSYALRYPGRAAPGKPQQGRCQEQLYLGGFSERSPTTSKDRTADRVGRAEISAAWTARERGVAEERSEKESPRQYFSAHRCAPPRNATCASWLLWVASISSWSFSVFLWLPVHGVSSRPSRVC